MSADFKFMQIALNSCDLAGSLQFYSEVFGFANAGGQALWGDVMGIQGLDPSSRLVMWWLVGRQQAVQLELFHHTKPQQRPMPSDHTPADHGWTRIGLGVPDFDRTLATLAGWGVTTITDPIRVGDGRRVAFRDPFVGVVIELFEEAGLPQGLRRRHFDLDPFVVYATCSVADLDQSRHFYGSLLGLELSENSLHQPEHEALWGLGGAQTRSCLAKAGDIVIELVEYLTPRGRPKAADHLISDQGMMNIALRSHDAAAVRTIMVRLEAEGCRTTGMGETGLMAGGYVLSPDREVELLGGPPELDGGVGLLPTAPFIGISYARGELDAALLGKAP